MCVCDLYITRMKPSVVNILGKYALNGLGNRCISLPEGTRNKSNVTGYNGLSLTTYKREGRRPKWYRVILEDKVLSD